MATVDPVSTRVFAFLLRVSRVVSPLLPGPPRVVPILAAVLTALHALCLRVAAPWRDQQRGRGEKHDRYPSATTDCSIHVRPPSNRLRSGPNVACCVVPVDRRIMRAVNTWTWVPARRRPRRPPCT